MSRVEFNTSRSWYGNAMCAEICNKSYRGRDNTSNTVSLSQIKLWSHHFLRGILSKAITNAGNTRCFYLLILRISLPEAKLWIVLVQLHSAIKNKDFQSETNHIFFFSWYLFMTGFTVGEHILVVQGRKNRKIITTIFLLVLWVIRLPEKQDLSLFYYLLLLSFYSLLLV